MENWCPVPGYEGKYEVSDKGRVRRVARRGVDGRRLKSKILSARPQKSGHLSVCFVANGAQWNELVHRLVLIAFIGPPPVGMHALHRDGDPANNRLSNLRWGTPSDNSLDAVRHGVHPQARKTHCKSGHEFTPENTRVDSRNFRTCRKCERERTWRRRHPERKVA